MKRKCNRNCKSHRLPGEVLLNNIQCSKAVRRISSFLTLSEIKHIFKESAFQNGNFRIRDSVSKCRGLGLFYRSFSRLFAYSYPFWKPRISKICCRREDLSVSSTFFRNFCCPVPINKSSFNPTLLGHLRQRGLHPHDYWDDLLTHVSDIKIISSNVRKTANNSTNSETGFHNKFRKVNSKPKTDFSECSHRFAKSCDFSNFRSLQVFERFELALTKKNLKMNNNSKTVKNNKFVHRSGTLGKVTHKTSSTASLVPLKSDGEKYILRDPTI